MSELLRAEDVAQMMNIGKSTVYLLVKENRIPYVRFGESVRFPRHEIEAWLAEQVRRPLAS